MQIDRSVDILKHFEGFRAKAYEDTTGHLTIGYGFNIDAGIDERAASALIEHQVTELYADLMRFEWFDNLDEVRKSVIVQMAFQMGISNLLKFRKTLHYVKEGNYKQAAVEMLNSLWAKQAPARANQVAKMMAKGEWL